MTRPLIFILLIFAFPSWGFDGEKAASRLRLETGIEGKPWTFLGTHAVYVNEDLSRQLMLVRNVPGTLDGTRFIDADTYLIVNIPESKTTFTSVAVVGISRESLLPLIQSTTFDWKKFFSLIPRAHADTDCTPGGLAGIPGISELTTFFTTGAGAGFARCLMNFAQGAWASTGGVVTGFLEGVGNLFSDPRAFWDRRVEQMRKMWQFITHFNSQMRTLYREVSNLPAETKTQMMCGFLGGVGAAVGVTLLTAGAGIGPLMARVTSYVGRVSGLSRTLSLFAGLGKLDQIPSRFFEGIASGRIGEGVIDRIDSFSRNRMDVMAQGAIQCAL